MTQIIADSTCDLAETLLRPYSLCVLPLTISVDGRDYADGVDLSVAELHKLMRRGIFPGTAQIAYDTMRSCFARCCADGIDFIYLAFSSEMSGCCSLARVIIDELQPLYPAVRMTAFDTRGGSSATGLIALQALKMAAAGAPYDDILAEITAMTGCVEHIFSVADLNWMVKGGRIAKPLGFVGSRLSLRPWLDVEGGRMVVKGIVRGTKKAVETVAQEVARRAAAFPDQLIAITHADDPDAAASVQMQLKSLLPACRTTICQIGGVLSVHIGLGGVGVFFFRERTPRYCLTGEALA